MRKDVIASDAVRSGMVRPGQKLSFKNHRSSISFSYTCAQIFNCYLSMMLSMVDSI